MTTAALKGSDPRALQKVEMPRLTERVDTRSKEEGISKLTPSFLDFITGYHSLR